MPTSQTSWSASMLLMLTALAALAAVSDAAVASDYAVVPAPQGDDGGDGSAGRPWATVGQALTRVRSGDTIHLLRGAVYRERSGLTFPAGVTLKADGPEDQPAPWLTTSVVVPALKPWEKNPKVLTAKVDKPVLECYVEGRFLVLARFPNLGQGWMRAQKGSGPDAIVDAQREKVPGAAVGKWKGAQVRWRRWSWWWETRPITDDDGKGRIALGPDGRFQDPFAGEYSAWYVDNSLAELDAPGEWFWDAASGTLYVYPPADADAKHGDAKKQVVEVVVEAKGFISGGATLNGVGFARIAGNALTIGRTSTLIDCAFQDIGDTAVTGGWEAAGTRISGCTFRDVRNIAISWFENPGGNGGTLIERNQLERIGMQFGYGGSGSWHAAGIIVNGAKNPVVRLNRVVDTGYAGIIVGSAGVTVERNVFVRCMGSLNDGAAIYVNASSATMRENVILDTVGNLDTSQWWYPLGHGIWCEFLSDFKDQVITGNTVYGSGGNGVFLTNNYGCKVTDNVLVGNRMAGLHLSGKDGRAAGHAISGNVLATQETSRRLSFAENIPANWKGNDRQRALSVEDRCDFGSMSGTVFVTVAGTALASVPGNGAIDDPSALKQACAWADPSPRALRGASLLLINDTEQSHDFPAPAGGWRDLAGKAIAKTVTVAPFRSALLVREGDGTALPPYLLASGVDYRAPPGKGVATKSKTKAKPAVK